MRHPTTNDLRGHRRAAARTGGARRALGRAAFGAIALSLVSAACTPRRIAEYPLMENGPRIDKDAGVEEQRSSAEAERIRREDYRDALLSEALSTCDPATCEAVLRGEVTLGMNEAQVLAASRTTEAAWSIRRSDFATVMTPRSLSDPPRDAVADLAMVRLGDAGVASLSYRDAGLLRVVDSPFDATLEGRGAALAELMVREGDDYAARGEFDLALNRYDRADLLSDDPLIEYKIARALDKQLRPIEAQIQYELFLHRLEIEKIEARGDAASPIGPDTADGDDAESQAQEGQPQTGSGDRVDGGDRVGSVPQVDGR